MSEENAVTLDRSGRLIEAAEEYERAIASGEVSLCGIINATILYWRTTDFGLAAALKIPQEFVNEANERYVQLLEDGGRRFPGSTELKFWKKYIARIEYGDAIDIEFCERLLREDPHTLAPAMYIYVVSERKQAIDETNKLLKECKEDGTYRAKYIMGVIEAVKERQW